MKTLNSAPKFLSYAVLRAIRHPRTLISYYYCPNCKTSSPTSEKACPKCHYEASNLFEINESPIPWYGSVVVIIIGVICWIMGAGLEIVGLSEAGRVLVYIPLGNLFGMSLQR